MNSKTIRVGMTVLFLFASIAAAANAQAPRIALLLNQDGKHQDEFDGALAELGWSADRYAGTAEKMSVLAAHLGDYDLLIAAPLFNLSDPPVLPGENRKAFMKFLEEGGLIAVTDGSYAGVRRWLADISPSLGGLESGACNSSQWAVNGVTSDATPPHPLRFFPSRIREPNSWPHFRQPPAGSAWRTVATCSEGFPVTFAQTVGRGLVSISALRQPSAKQLVNFYACLQLCRAGLALQSFSMPAPTVGDGAIRLTFAGASAARACGFVYEIAPDQGAKQRFEREVPAAATAFELPYRISCRGPATARLLFKRDGRESALFAQRIELPQLLTVTPCANRGILSAARRLPTAGFDVGLAPDRESLEGTRVSLAVLDASGRTVAATNRPLDDAHAPQTFRLPVLLERALPAGTYAVRAALARGAQALAESQTAIRILSPVPAQTIIDEDNTLLVGGQPFFPLGLYHVTPARYAEVAALGINAVQFWAWDAGPDGEGLSRAAEHRLKVLFELNHKSAQIIRETAARYAGHPALLMWYGLDEPAEGSYGLAETMRDAFHASDSQHPVFTVSCRPDLFAEQARFADVFALDPYGKPPHVLEWITRAAAAANHRKPVVCVLGVFGKETAEELRAAAYLALAHDARGIFWYPWCQMGGGPAGVGLQNSPAQQAVVRQLCAEIRALTPALTAPDRRTFQSDDATLHGLLCATAQQRVLLLVNGTPEKVENDVRLPGAEGENTDWGNFFDKDASLLTVRSGLFHIALKPYETCVFEHRP